MNKDRANSRRQFGIAGFNDAIDSALSKVLHEATIYGLVAFGETLYGPEVDLNSAGMGIQNEYGGYVWQIADDNVWRRTGNNLKSIMDDEDLWAQICQTPAYLKNALEHIMAQDSFKFKFDN